MILVVADYCDYFFKDLINEATYVDEKYIDSEAISVFVSSW